jgi:hypothetical protein
MNPVDLIPAADAIPVHWGWFKVLLILTFTVHILLMNAMLGTGIIAFVSRLTCDDETRDLQKDVSDRLTFLIAFAVNFGVAPLLFLQTLYGQFFYVSSQLMAVFWLSAIGLLIIGYYAAYLYKYKFDALAARRNWALGTAVAILLLVAFIFVNNMTLMITPLSWPRYFANPQGTLLNLIDPTLAPRYLHFVTASIAMGGLFIALAWEFKKRGGAPNAQANIRRGLNWFLYATLFQIIFGFWFQMTLPDEILHLFMGGSTLHTGIFLTALGGLALALIFGIQGRVRPTAAAAIAVVFLMILMRDLVRTAYLSPYFSPGDLTVTGEHSPLVAFLFALIIGAVAVAIMVKWGLAAASTSNR